MPRHVGIADGMPASSSIADSMPTDIDTVDGMPIHTPRLCETITQCGMMFYTKQCCQLTECSLFWRGTLRSLRFFNSALRDRELRFVLQIQQLRTPLFLRRIKECVCAHQHHQRHVCAHRRLFLFAAPCTSHRRIAWLGTMQLRTVFLFFFKGRRSRGGDTAAAIASFVLVGATQLAMPFVFSFGPHALLLDDLTGMPCDIMVYNDTTPLEYYSCECQWQHSNAS